MLRRHQASVDYHAFGIDSDAPQGLWKLPHLNLNALIPHEALQVVRCVRLSSDGGCQVDEAVIGRQKWPPRRDLASSCVHLG